MQARLQWNASLPSLPTCAQTCMDTSHTYSTRAHTHTHTQAGTQHAQTLTQTHAHSLTHTTHTHTYTNTHTHARTHTHTHTHTHQVLDIARVILEKALNVTHVADDGGDTEADTRGNAHTHATHAGVAAAAGLAFLV